MFFQKYINKAKKWLMHKSRFDTLQEDAVEVKLPGLSIILKRKIEAIDTPHEVTVVVPRVEMRKKCLNEDCSIFEYELIYNSITVVHAPRHPLAGSSPSPPPKAQKRGSQS